MKLEGNSLHAYKITIICVKIRKTNAHGGRAWGNGGKMHQVLPLRYPAVPNEWGFFLAKIAGITEVLGRI